MKQTELIEFDGIIKKLYLEDGLSSIQIGKLYNTSNITIVKFLKNAGITTRNNSESVLLKKQQKRANKKGKICDRCGLNSERFRRGICGSCYSFDVRNKHIITNKPCNINVLSQVQIEHLIGLLLGDGSIEMGKLAKHARLIVGRQSKDKEYCVWQNEIFKNICSDNTLVKDLSFFDQRTNKTYKRSYFKTRNCPIISDYHKKWYPDGIKIVPKDIELSPLILLIWFLDDGSVSYREYKKTGNSTMVLSLATMGFSKEENIFLSQKLSKVINGEVKVVGNEKRGYSLLMLNSSSRKFIKLIDPIFPDCMLRKAKWRDKCCDFYRRNVE